MREGGRGNAGPAATGVVKWGVIINIIITFALLEEIEPKTENVCVCTCSSMREAS